jgi:hypothetical protein
VVDQHALTLVWSHLDERLGGKSPIGPPKHVERVMINSTVLNPAETIAHELGHAVGMPHHGTGNYWRWDPRDATRNVYVAVQHGQNSGVLEGIMRYRAADYIKHMVGGKWQLDDYGPDAGLRTMFAEKDDGTGKAGDATPGCGNSLRRLVVSDRYDVDLATVLVNEGCITLE